MSSWDFIDGTRQINKERKTRYNGMCPKFFKLKIEEIQKKEEYKKCVKMR